MKWRQKFSEVTWSSVKSCAIVKSNDFLVMSHDPLGTVTIIWYTLHHVPHKWLKGCHIQRKPLAATQGSEDDLPIGNKHTAGRDGGSSVYSTLWHLVYHRQPQYEVTTVFSTIQFKSPDAYFLLGKLPQICHTHACTFTHTDQCAIAHTKTSIETQRQKLRPLQCLWPLASPQQKVWSHTQLAGVANWSWIWWLMDWWTCP